MRIEYRGWPLIAPTRMKKSPRHCIRLLPRDIGKIPTCRHRQRTDIGVATADIARPVWLSGCPGTTARAPGSTPGIARRGLK
jgi:hypothetical protein